MPANPTDEPAPAPSPLDDAWQELANRLEKAPDPVLLPRAEMVRLCEAFFRVGAATALMPVLIGFTKLDDDTTDLETLRTVAFAIGASIPCERTGTLDQLLATMEAHAR